MASENEMNETLLLSQETLPPKSAKDKIAVIAAIALTVLWGVSAWSFLGVSGWWNARYEMTPPEYFSCLTGLLSPVAFIWVAAAYFASERRFVREADVLRAYIAELTHPSAKNKLYVSGVLDSLKMQTENLNAVYARLKDCSDSVGQIFDTHTADVEKATQALAETLTNASGCVAEKTKELNQSCAAAKEQTDSALNLLHEKAAALQTAANETSAALERAGEKLNGEKAALRETSDAMTDNLNRLTADVREQSDLLRAASEKARDVLSEQTGIAAQEIGKHAADLTAVANSVHDKLSRQAADLKQNIQAHLSLLAEAGDKARDDMAAIGIALDEQSSSLKNAAQTALTGMETSADLLERRVSDIKRALTDQTEAVAAKNDVLVKMTERLIAKFGEQNAALDNESEKRSPALKTSKRLWTLI